MPVGIKTPSNQIKTTNLSVVRMRKGKKRFEIACYKNKILDWRDEIETEKDNVLQIHTVYLNVNKGQAAPKADLDKAWPGKTEEEIIEDMLWHGDFQVGEMERGAKLDRTKNEIIDLVASKLVDPKSKRVYTTGMIEKALDQLSSQAATQQKEKTEPENGEEKGKALPMWTGVRLEKDAKSQALFAVKALVAHQPIPVARIQMKLRITCPTSVLKQSVKSAPMAAQLKDAANGQEKSSKNVKDTILGLMEKVQSQDTVGAEWEAIGLVEPGTFKMLNEFIDSHGKGRGNVEVLDTAVGVDV